MTIPITGAPALLDDFKRFVGHAEAGSQFAAWKRDNPVDYGKWASYRDAIVAGGRPAAPFLATSHGRELVDVGLIYLDATPAAPPPPTPPPGAWSVMPPQNPATKIANKNGIGLLLNGAPDDVHDVIMDGTSNSGFLFGPECAGSTFKRIHGTRIASIDPYPGYGRHMFYAKAPNILYEDIYSQIGGAPIDTLGSVFSLRYAGQTINRCQVAACKWFASFFDDDPAHKPGAATFTDGDVTWANGTDYAMIVSSQIPWTITFRGYRFTGPSDRLLTIDSSSVAPVLEFDGCTSNGKPVTAAMIGGKAPAKLVLA